MGVEEVRAYLTDLAVNQNDRGLIEVMGLEVQQRATPWVQPTGR